MPNKPTTLRGSQGGDGYNSPVYLPNTGEDGKTPTTLREEFYKEFGHLQVVKNEISGNQYKGIADWWLDKFSSHNTELIRKIEEMPRWTLKLPDNGLLEGRTRELVDGDEVINIINQEK